MLELIDRWFILCNEMDVDVMDAALASVMICDYFIRVSEDPERFRNEVQEYFVDESRPHLDSPFKNTAPPLFSGDSENIEEDWSFIADGGCEN